MNKLRFTAIGLIIFSLFGCTVSKIIKSEVSPNEISSLDFIPPYSKISLVNIVSEYNDSLSRVAEKLIIQEINGQAKRLRLRNRISMSNKTLNNDLRNLVFQIKKAKDVKKVPLPSHIDSLLETNNSQYALFVYHEGFTRTRLNKVLCGAVTALSILAGHGYYRNPAFSIFHCIIIDARNNNIAFYRRSSLSGYEPLEPDVLYRQLDDILNKYYPL